MWERPLLVLFIGRFKMAAADITVNNQWATIECDDVARLIVSKDARGSLTNYGDESVFLSMLGPAGSLNRDGIQRDGEIELVAGGAIPLPPNTTKVHFQCAAGLTTKLWYIPTVK